MPKDFKKILTPIFMVIFGLGSFQGVRAEEALRAVYVTRISHPAYNMHNLWQGEGFGNDNGGSGLWNKNHTRVIMYEGWTTQTGFENGRGLVWGDLNVLKNFGQEFVVNNGIITGSSIYKGTLADYQNNTHNIPDGFDGAPVWSLFDGEENILYAVCDDEITQPWRCGSLQNHLVRYDTDNGVYTDVADLNCTGSCSGQTVANPQIAGWTTDHTLMISLSGATNPWKGNWEVDVHTGERIYHSGRPNDCSSVGHRWPWAKRIHSGRSLNKLYIASYNDGAYVQSNDYANNNCGSYGEYWDNFGAANYFSHCQWSWNNDWYICSANGYSHNTHTNPYLTAGTFQGDKTKDYAIFQIFFNKDTHEFAHNLLLTHSTAGYWCPTGNCGVQDENYHGLMTPTLRNDGRQIMYLGTGGVYSLEDYSLRGVTPYGTQGVFLADLSSAEDNPADVDGIGGVNIKDIQACIKVITNSQTDTNIITKCNALAEPIGNTNIKDIQVIIREIIR